MAPPQTESTLVYDDRMDEAQYTSGYNLHPELQSYSNFNPAHMHGYQGFAQPPAPGNFAQPDLVGVSYPLPNTWAFNNTFVSPVQADQYPALTNVNDDHYSNVYESWQPSSVLPSYYALEATDLLAPSTGVDQSGNTFFPTYDVGNAVPQSYVPSLLQSASMGFSIGATAEVSIASPYPTSVSETLHESSSNLHGPIQTPEPNTCQGCRQSFPSNAELERHAKSLHHDAFECKCGKHYARLDILKRHWNQTPKFPCQYCNQYTGANAFSREDHLTQHLRTFHRINTSAGNQDDANTPTTTMQFSCTLPNCTHQRSFKTKSQCTDHMRRIHNYSPFPCLVQDCVKTGGKGYFRKRDLLKHSQEAHSVEN